MEAWTGSTSRRRRVLSIVETNIMFRLNERLVWSSNDEVSQADGVIGK